MADVIDPVTNCLVTREYTVINSYMCDVCEKTFSLKTNLNKHIKRKHSDQPEMFFCNYCGFVTDSKYSFLRHQNRKHTDNSKANVICALCHQFCCSTREEMVIHYSSFHDITFVVQNLEFKSKTEFFEWKKDVQKEHSCEFVRKQSSYKSIVDGSTKLAFFCHRDGVFHSTGENKRRLKFNGSNKINGHCPAKITATFYKSGRTCVELCETHVGHGAELRRVRLCKEEKIKIAEKIFAKVPFDKILEEIHSSSSPDERIHLITRKDLLNIAQEFKTSESGESKTESDSENAGSVIKIEDLGESEYISSEMMVTGLSAQCDAEDFNEIGQDGTIVIEVGNNQENDIVRERKDKLLLKFKNILKESETEEHLDIVERYLEPILPAVQEDKKKPVVKITSEALGKSLQFDRKRKRFSIKKIGNKPQISITKQMNEEIVVNVMLTEDVEEDCDFM